MIRPLLVALLLSSAGVAVAQDGPAIPPPSANAKGPALPPQDLFHTDPATVEPSPERAEGLHREGLAAWAAGDLRRAVDLLEAATAAAPDDLLIGTDYRQAVIALADTLDARTGDDKAPYDRALAFFGQLVSIHPDAANAHLNLAFAHVDKIPVEGAITQVILANTSLGHFAAALELDPSWLAYYSRGHAYLFWPPVFGRVDAGIADLERAVEIAREAEDAKPYHARAWAALGDGFWRKDDVEGARATWEQGLERFPDDPELLARLRLEDRAELDAFLNAHYETTRRVGTHLNEIFGERMPDRSVEERRE